MSHILPLINDRSPLLFICMTTERNSTYVRVRMTLYTHTQLKACKEVKYIKVNTGSYFRPFLTKELDVLRPNFFFITI